MASVLRILRKIPPSGRSHQNWLQPLILWIGRLGVWKPGSSEPGVATFAQGNADRQDNSLCEIYCSQRQAREKSHRSDATTLAGDRKPLQPSRGKQRSEEAAPGGPLPRRDWVLTERRPCALIPPFCSGPAKQSRYQADDTRAHPFGRWTASAKARFRPKANQRLSVLSPAPVCHQPAAAEVFLNGSSNSGRRHDLRLRAQ